MIVTSALLASLEPIAQAEGLTMRDPWEAVPSEAYGDSERPRAVVLRLDGTVARELDPELIEWDEVAAYRLETCWGLPLAEVEDDDSAWEY